MNTKIRYDLRGAFEADIKEHPQKDVKRLGMKILYYEGIPMADCVIMEVENIPEKLPDYITIVQGL